MFGTAFSFRRAAFASSAVVAAVLALVLPSWLPAPRASASPAAPPAAHSDPVCVFGVSKDSCEGEVCCGQAKFVTCTRDGVNCRSVIVSDSSFKFTLRQSPGLCSDPGSPTLGRCDETEKLDGTVAVRGGFVLRQNLPCRFRGCWEGEFVLETDDGIVGSGKASGTLGTGSQRSPTCPSNVQCATDCEGCHEVQFFPDPGALTGTWRIHVEGVLNGSITSGSFESSTLCVAVQGYWTTRGTIQGPFDVTSWKFCGTTDGVVLAKCVL